MQRQREHDSIVFVTLTELGYPRPTIREAIRLAKGINREAGLMVLARLNIYQSLANLSKDFELRTKIQEKLISGVISEHRLRELKDKLQSAHVGYRPLVQRAQLLVAIKLVAAFGTGNGGNRLESRDDWDVLGELALVINSLFDFGGLAGMDKHVVDRELAAQMSPIIELENPSAIANGMVRMSEMLGPILERKSSSFVREIQTAFLFLTSNSNPTAGLDFQGLLDLVLALYGFYSARQDDILNFSGSVFFNPYNPEHIVSSPYLDGFLKHHSINFGEIIGSLDSPDRGRSYLLDYTLFRRWPFWRLTPESYICVDPTFLAEKLSSVGFYWSIMNTLDTDERKEQFAALWGELFQEYVFDLFADIYGMGPMSRFFPSPEYESPQEEAFDTAILYGDAIILIQIKGPFVPVEAKYSGEPDSFFDGISQKFGLERGAAVEQLVRNLKFSLPNSSTPQRKIRGVDLTAVRRVFPVVIYQEPILRFGLVTKVLTEEFVKEIACIAFRFPVLVRPVIFLNVEDLEALSQYIKEGHPSFIEFLDAKLNEDPTHFNSFHDFFAHYFLRQGKIPKKTDDRLEEKWQALTAQSLNRFESGYYQN